MAVPTTLRQTPLTCSGHTRPVVDLAFSGFTEKGYFLISACKGINSSNCVISCFVTNVFAFVRWKTNDQAGRHR